MITLAYALVFVSTLAFLAYMAKLVNEYAINLQQIAAYHEGAKVFALSAKEISLAVVNAERSLRQTLKVMEEMKQAPRPLERSLSLVQIDEQ